MLPLHKRGSISRSAAGPPYIATDFEGNICPVVGSVAGEPYVEGNAYLSAKFTYQLSHIWRQNSEQFNCMYMTDS